MWDKVYNDTFAVDISMVVICGGGCIYFGRSTKAINTLLR